MADLRCPEHAPGHCWHQNGRIVPVADKMVGPEICCHCKRTRTATFNLVLSHFELGSVPDRSADV